MFLWYCLRLAFNLRNVPLQGPHMRLSNRLDVRRHVLWLEIFLVCARPPRNFNERFRQLHHEEYDAVSQGAMSVPSRSLHSSRKALGYRPTAQQPLQWVRRITRTRPVSRSFHAHAKHQQQHRKESFSSRLRVALDNTKIIWRPIPVGLGIAFLGAVQLSRIRSRQKAEEEEARSGNGDRTHEDGHEGDEDHPKKRQRIRPSGPWQVQVMSTLPLKALSRLWGRFNELDIPYYLRIPGFKLYGWIFGVNFDEVSEPDLHVYPNLASFFYRELKPGVRPLDPNPNAVLSPADGRVVQFGAIESGEVEQVKGVTYSLDALLGSRSPSKTDGSQTAPTSNIAASPNSPQPREDRSQIGDEDMVHAEEEFANVNGISYTLSNLFSGTTGSSIMSWIKPQDQSTKYQASSEAEVHADLALGAAAQKPWWSPSSSPATPTALYYIVVYLAPGDYHRFHSPVSWVVSSRRHFAGELYSVSPYLQRTLPGLFTLNERVVLLGRWRWGFFSYTPVGATNVGSIKINFDRELRTNSLTTDTAADREAERAADKGEPYSGFAEATYHDASRLLQGHPLKRGEEMGGFQLGSTIVLVFEAPKGRRPSFDEGFIGSGTEEDMRRGGWKWAVEKGQKVKVGQALGFTEEQP